jgi:hypothetical protein
VQKGEAGNVGANEGNKIKKYIYIYLTSIFLSSLHL